MEKIPNQGGSGDSLPAIFVKEGALQIATLGMGCFWSPEALFGQLPGVVRTRVGYAGGTTPHPVYREMGDHSETVRLEFDPNQITFRQLLEVFWAHHNPANINGYKGRQYLSLVLYHDEEQRAAAVQLMAEMTRGGKEQPATEVAPYAAFYPAEDRHQKYYLKRYPDAVEKLSSLYPSEALWVNSTLAARLNAIAKGYLNLSALQDEISGWEAGQTDRERMLGAIRQIRW
ncbi:peptide-methionine (S)-S-oxide reductase [Paenibacillus sp. CAA11]|nr:peptide-methionine (S)-S-oxide reductase [Paenibacillus sp. CAA11]